MLIHKFGSSLRQMALGLLMAGAMGATAHAAMINVSASPTSVTVGGTVSVFFDISGLAADAMSLYSFQINYDNSVLGFSGISFADPGSLRNELDLPEASSFGFAGSVADLGGGVLDVFGLSGNSATSLNSVQADAFRFLTLTFDTLAVSMASAVRLDVGSSLFGDAFANPLSLSFQAAGADIAVTAGGSVPEPGALSLALLGLVGACAATRSARRRVVGGLAGVLALSGAVLAQQVQPPPQGAAGGTTIDAVVVKVQGARLQVRSADGREFWVTAKSNVAADVVGKRLTGQASTRGDTLVISSPVYTRTP